MIRIATYNIQGGVGLDGRLDLDRIVEVIADVDIIGLQEVEVAWDRSNNVDGVSLIAEKMPDHYMAWGPYIDIVKSGPSGIAGPREPRRQLGNMILSRFPIRSIRHHLLPRYGAAHVFDMARSAIEAVVAAPGGDLLVYSSHLDHLTEATRIAQAERLMEIIRNAPYEGPPLSGVHDREPSWSSEPPLPAVPRDALFLGGVNATPDSASFAVLTGEASARKGRMTRLGQFVDAWEVAKHREGVEGPNGPDGATRYTEQPFKAGSGRRVDFCLVPLAFKDRVMEARVLSDAVGSDHLPVLATLDVG